MNIEYLISALVDAECRREGCLKVFGKEWVADDDMPRLVKEAGRAVVYRNNTFSNGAVVGAESFEDFCEKKVYSYPMAEHLTKAMLIKAFRKELRKDYDTYCEKENAEDNR